MERWNSGFSKGIIHFKLYRQDEFYHLPNIAVSQDPFFPGPDRIYEMWVLCISFCKIKQKVANYQQVAPGRANIPAFHHSNWGEAPNLTVDRIELIILLVMITNYI